MTSNRNTKCSIIALNRPIVIVRQLLLLPVVTHIRVPSLLLQLMIFSLQPLGQPLED